MSAAFKQCYTEVYEGQTAIYLDCDPNIPWKEHKVEYLGWTGFPADYINYASARKGRQMETIKVFPMKIISS